MQVGFAVFALPEDFVTAIVSEIHEEVSILTSVESTISFVQAHAQAPAILICQPSALPPDSTLLSSLDAALGNAWFRVLALANGVDRAAMAGWPASIRRHVILLPTDDDVGSNTEQVQLVAAQLKSEVYEATTQSLFQSYEKAYATDARADRAGLLTYMEGILQSVAAFAIAAYLLDGDGTQIVLDQGVGRPTPRHLHWPWFDDQFLFHSVCRVYRLSEEQRRTLHKLSHEAIDWPVAFAATFRVDETPVAVLFGFDDQHNLDLRYKICATAARELFHLYRARDMAATLSTLQNLSEITNSDRDKGTVLWAMLSLLKSHFHAHGASLLEVVEDDPARLKFQKVFLHQGRRDREMFTESSGFAHYCVVNRCALNISETRNVDGKWFGLGDAYDPSRLLAGTGKPVSLQAYVTPKAVEVERSVMYYPIVAHDRVVALLKIADFQQDHAYNVRHIKQIRTLLLPVASFLDDVNMIASLRARLEHEEDNKKLVELANTLFLYREIALGMFHQVTNHTNRVESELMLVETLLQSDRRSSELDTRVAAARAVVREAKELIRKAQQRGRSLTPIREECRLVTDIVRPALLYIEREHKEITLKHSLTASEYAIEVDPAYMRESLYNLLNNAVWAVKHNHSNRREIFVAVRPVDDGAVRIHVEDSGLGIDSDFRPNLFKPFATTREHGTGLGLYFAKQLIEHFGGRLELERSMPGRTIFAITLPLKGAHNAVAAQRSQATEVPMDGR